MNEKPVIIVTGKVPNVEAFFSMNQEAWTTAHVNAYKYFGGVTRIIQCDNLKTGVQKHGKDEVILNISGTSESTIRTWGQVFHDHSSRAEYAAVH